MAEITPEDGGSVIKIKLSSLKRISKDLLKN